MMILTFLSILVSIVNIYAKYICRYLQIESIFMLVCIVDLLNVCKRELYKKELIERNISGMAHFRIENTTLVNYLRLNVRSQMMLHGECYPDKNSHLRLGLFKDGSVSLPKKNISR